MTYIHTDKIEVCNDGFDKVVPNFIYNRCDLMQDGESYLLKYMPKDIYIPLKIKKNEGVLCVWGMQLAYQEIKDVIDYVMGKFREIDRITVMRVCADKSYPDKYIKNDFQIILPDSIEELDLRLSKKGRYNIKREKRIVENNFGGCQFVHIKSDEVDADTITQKFFELKKKNMGSDYGMTAKAYLKNWYVSDIYYLLFGEKIASVLMSCEQCENVYLENITYDDELANYSPGQIAYDFYLKELIQDGKKSVFLLGGNYDYKKRYGSIENNVAEYSVLRKSIKSYVKVYGKQVLIKAFNMMPQGIKSIYLSRK